MTYQGTVKGGKLELERPLDLPEGTPVQVEVVVGKPEAPRRKGQKGRTVSKDQWLKQWREFAQEVTDNWQSPQSALEVLSEMRR